MPPTLKKLYAPNFEKVDGAYCFWSVRGWVRGWVTLFVPTVTFKPLKLESSVILFGHFYCLIWESFPIQKW